MEKFLYISDVFCPWCYGFSKNIANIKKEFGLPFTVYSGALVEPAVSLEQRYKNNPNLIAFIDKMESITGVRLSDSYVSLMQGATSSSIFMDSRKAGHLFYTLKHFKPELGLEIMEFLQHCFYGLGEDVFSDNVLNLFCKTFSCELDLVKAYYATKESEENSYNETELGFDILGDVVLYPTFYYVNNNENYFISRGYVDYNECKNKILSVMNTVKLGKTVHETEIIGKSCTLDGKCD